MSISKLDGSLSGWLINTSYSYRYIYLYIYIYTIKHRIQPVINPAQAETRAVPTILRSGSEDHKGPHQTPALCRSFPRENAAVESPHPGFGIALRVGWNDLK